VRAAFERLGTLLAEPMEEPPGSRVLQAPLRSDIRFERVPYRYGKNGSKVLETIDLHVERGEFLGIIGPSGSGKSTFVKLLQGLYRPKTDRILIDGTDIRHLPRSVLRREISVVPQEIQLFAGTVRDNIALGGETEIQPGSLPQPSS
jgi:ABC-type bacteriocin/lantibiotic exporter with double-glycine peptidase domain